MASLAGRSSGRGWTGVATGLLALAFPVVISATVNPVAAQSRDTLRVMVFNIHAGRDAEGTDNLRRVGRVIRDAEADIALLQEVDRGTERSGGVDQSARLGWLTGLYDAFGPTLDFQGGTYGVAMLSRWPATGRSVRPLPVDPPSERAGGSLQPRAALVLTLRTPRSTLHVVDTHLDPSPDGRARTQEIAGLLGVLEALTGAPDALPVLVGGDFNAEPGTPWAQAMEGAGWRDAWVTCGGGAGVDDGLTYPANDPVKRIDYLWLGPGVECLDARVVPSEASDHRPLLVTVVIPGP